MNGQTTSALGNVHNKLGFSMAFVFDLEASEDRCMDRHADG